MAVENAGLSFKEVTKQLYNRGIFPGAGGVTKVKKERFSMEAPIPVQVILLPYLVAGIIDKKESIQIQKKVLKEFVKTDFKDPWQIHSAVMDAILDIRKEPDEKK